MTAQNHDEKNVGQLKSEIDERNKGRADGDKIQAEGNKGDLVAALQLDDERAAGLATPGAVAPAQSPIDEDGEPKKVVPELVKLVHPDHDGSVEVFKPSAEYTNYVRGYRYQEAK